MQKTHHREHREHREKTAVECWAAWEALNVKAQRRKGSQRRKEQD